MSTAQYSTVAIQVRRLTLVQQSLKDTFAAKIPENQEKVKKLRKSVDTGQNMPETS